MSSVQPVTPAVMPDDDEAQVCPACGGHNDAEAVFCANPACGKALGEFRYIAEEMRAGGGFVQRLADTTNRIAGWPHFFTLHVVWFLVWFLVNSGLVAAFVSFDAYPFDLLGLILGVEAALLASLLLISNNSQNVHSSKRAELDYEVTVRTYRKVAQLERQLQALADQLKAGGL
jgi:uncharacterized membrane protein